MSPAHRSIRLLERRGDVYRLLSLNCGVMEDCSRCHGWRVKRTNGCWTIFIGSVLMPIKSMGERNMRFFGNIDENQH